ncbi:MAG: DUF1090 domain-containing protein [Sulfurimonas sp.]|nr:DUF1090 domain-containing protein [Sulfurimonas sp.]
MISKFYWIPISLGILLLSGCTNAVDSSVVVNCDGLKGCEQKICNLKNDINIAKKTNNENRVDGLVISLNKVKKHCTDEGMIEEIQDKIRDTKKDSKEDTKNYEEAVKDAKLDKIKKYETKMAEEKQELKQLEDELKQLN